MAIIFTLFYLVSFFSSFHIYFFTYLHVTSVFYSFDKFRLLKHTTNMIDDLIVIDSCRYHKRCKMVSHLRWYARLQLFVHQRLRGANRDELLQVSTPTGIIQAVERPQEVLDWVHQTNPHGCQRNYKVNWKCLLSLLFNIFNWPVT